MKINKTLTALIAGASIGMSGQSLAKGTDAGESITNNTSLSYKVGDVQQENVPASAVFKVDNKIDMTLLTQTSTKDFIPGDEVVYTYTLENSGNSDQHFLLSTINTATPSTADVADISVPTTTYEVTASTEGTTTLEVLTGGLVLLGVDDVITFTATLDFPKLHDDSLINDNIIINGNDFSLTAKVTAVDSGGTVIIADTSTDKNIISATDADNNLELNTLNVFADGSSIDSDDYDGFVTVETVSTAQTAEFVDANGDNGPGLTVKVINDPLCETGLTAATDDDDFSDKDSTNCPNNTLIGNDYTPKAIPGAMVQYEINATNVSTITATDVVFTQNLTTIDSDDLTSTTDLKSGSIGNVSATLEGTPLDVSSAISGDTLTVTVGNVIQDDTVIIVFTAIVGDGNP